MNEVIKEDSNCIIKAFEHTNITIIKESNTFLFRGSEIGKILNIVNIRTTIQNFDEDERVVRKAYDPQGHLQDTIFLTSRGVYRVLYNSKKEITKQFRKWVGNILDDLIFNQGKELKLQLEKYHLELEEHKKLLEEKSLENIKDKENILLQNYKDRSIVYLILIKDNLYKFGWSNEIQDRFKTHKKEIGEMITLIYCIESKNNILLEQQLKDYLNTTKFRKSQIFKTNTGKDKNQTELIEINDISIIQNKLELFNKSIYKDKDYLRIQILKLEIEKLKEERLTEKYRIKQKQIQQLNEEQLNEEQLDEELDNELELLPENTIDELEIKKLKLENQRDIKKEYYEKNKAKILEYQKEYRKNNKERLLEKKKEYYVENKEQIEKQRKEYREQNKDKVKEQVRNSHIKYYEKNKEKLLEKSKEYYENNKEKMNEINKNNYETNKERINEKRKEWNENNKDKMKEYRKKYREENKEELNKKAKEYYEKNKEIILSKRKNT